MEFQVNTYRQQNMIDITHEVATEVKRQGIQDGIVTIFIPHTTAGITINENADPDVQRDMIVTLEKVYPVHGDYRHFEGNSHAHIKASLMGSSATVIVEGGKLKLGRWQSIYLCEFDGPRNRSVYVKALGN